MEVAHDQSLQLRHQLWRRLVWRQLQVAWLGCRLLSPVVHKASLAGVPDYGLRSQTMSSSSASHRRLLKEAICRCSAMLVRSTGTQMSVMDPWPSHCDTAADRMNLDEQEFPLLGDLPPIIPSSSAEGDEAVSSVVLPRRRTTQLSNDPRWRLCGKKYPFL